MEKKYNTIKLFFNKTKPSEEPISSNIDDLDDFKIRREVISEYEDELHVCFSRKIVFKGIAYLFMALSILTILLTISKVLIGVSILSMFVSFLFKKEFSKRMRYYYMSISMIDNVIFKKYNMVMPPIE